MFHGTTVAMGTEALGIEVCALKRWALKSTSKRRTATKMMPPLRAVLLLSFLLACVSHATCECVFNEPFQGTLGSGFGHNLWGSASLCSCAGSRFSNCASPFDSEITEATVLFLAPTVGGGSSQLHIYGAQNLQNKLGVSDVVSVVEGEIT